MLNPSKFLAKFLGLFALWLLLSGHYTALPVTLGFFSALLVGFISEKMVLNQTISRSHRENNRVFSLKTVWTLLGYWGWLGKGIILATINLSYRIWHPELPITPSFIHLTAHQARETGRVFYANSITLTPGTLTVQLTDRALWVHVLTEETAQVLQTGEMDRRVTALEEK